MSGETILVVDDEVQILEVVRDYLQQAGFTVLTARDGQTGLTIARRKHPDLMVLDIMLPGDLDGLDVCRAIRRDTVLSALPIIMLTARVEEMDRLIGLELGADDYVTKPFSPREVVARVKAVLRRVKQDVGNTGVIRLGDLTIDVPKRTVTLADEPVSLTPTEFDILTTLAQHPGRPFTRAQLIERVYDTAYTGYDRAIDSHVANLRHKIEPDGDSPRYIVTVYGVGYKLEAPS
jgi:two-component system alkaline phosphatase synthesis response regulator PhoP